MPFHVYILKCAGDRLYVGSCEHLQARYEAHRAGNGAEFTRRFKPISIAYTENHSTRAAAMQREAQIKKWSKAKKRALVSGNFAVLKNLSVSHD